MKIRRVILQPRAWQDISETCDYLSKRYSAESVEAWYNGCIDAINSLANQAERCQIASESAKLGVELRQLLYRRHRSVYRILFVIREDAIRVVCVRHSARRALTEKDLPSEEIP
jgi:plasmid stabilization system protein ParE